MKKLFVRIKNFFWGRIPKEAAEIYDKIHTAIKLDLAPVKGGSRIGKHMMGGGEYTVATNIPNVFRDSKFDLVPAILIKEVQEIYPKFEEYDELREKAYDKISSILKRNIENTEEGYSGPSKINIIDNFFKIIIKNNFEFGNDPWFKYLNIAKSDFDKIKQEIYDDKDLKIFMKFRTELLKEGENMLKEISKHYKRDLLTPERRRTVLTICTILITAILAISTIYTTVQSSKLVKTQIEATPPLNPEIRFFTSDKKEDFFFANWELATPLAHNQEGTIERWEKEKFYMTFQNIGQLPAGWVTINIDKKNFWIPSGRIENLLSLDTEKVEFEIWYRGCYQLSTDEECNKDLVPLGIQYLNISINCQYCEKEIKDQIKICVYDEKENLCEELWSQKKS